jgi:NAD(P)-dependent dehydrogenase (short-subunit alcohol dehydrogenase family)
LGTAALSAVASNQQVVSTIEYKLNFLSPAFEGDELVAIGKVESQGKRILVVTCVVLCQNRDNKLIAKAMGTFNAYDAAKAGMVGMSRALAVELAPMGVRVNVVSPGLVATDIWQELLLAAGPDRERTQKYWATQMPMARPLNPSEIASPVVFLISEAASGITGTDMLVDAGMTAMLLSTPPFTSRNIDGGK